MAGQVVRAGKLEVERMWTASLRETTHREITPDRWKRIVLAAMDKAEEGDARARDWLTKMAGLDDRARIDVDDQSGVHIYLPQQGKATFTDAEWEVVEEKKS